MKAKPEQREIPIFKLEFWTQFLFSPALLLTLNNLVKMAELEMRELVHKYELDMMWTCMWDGS